MLLSKRPAGSCEEQQALLRVVSAVIQSCSEYPCCFRTHTADAQSSRTLQHRKTTSGSNDTTVSPLSQQQTIKPRRLCPSWRLHCWSHMLTFPKGRTAVFLFVCFLNGAVVIYLGTMRLNGDRVHKHFSFKNTACPFQRQHSRFQPEL